jgi:hypothetical protein
MNPEMPEWIAKLPTDEKGRPVPWFVAWIEGKPDFRVMDGRKLPIAYKERLCWICGEKLGRYLAFPIGPMCAINHISAEPPSHKECAIYAAQACPFLVTPKMHRRERDLPEDTVQPGGISIRRNPGVVLIWITESFTPIAVPAMNGGLPGVLFQVGEPVALFWFSEGRVATRAEVLESINSGLPLLEEATLMDPEPEESMAALKRQYERTLLLLPA